MSCRDFWEYIYEDMRASNEPNFETSLQSALYVFFEKGEGRTKPKDDSNIKLSFSTFGQELKKVRKLRGLTMKEAASKAKVSVSFLSDIERNTGNPSLKTLEDLASTYEISLFFKIEVKIGNVS